MEIALGKLKKIQHKRVHFEMIVDHRVYLNTNYEYAEWNGTNVFYFRLSEAEIYNSPNQTLYNVLVQAYNKNKSYMFKTCI